jgi:hypothetical protein
MATEIAPKIQEYRNEMQTVADRMFGDILKKIITWQVPTMLLGSMVSLNLIQAVTAFATALAPAVGSAVIDYVQARTHARRRHAISYLVDLAQTER